MEGEGDEIKSKQPSIRDRTLLVRSVLCVENFELESMYLISTAEKTKNYLVFSE